MALHVDDNIQTANTTHTHLCVDVCIYYWKTKMYIKMKTRTYKKFDKRITIKTKDLFQYLFLKCLKGVCVGGSSDYEFTI